MHQLALDFHKQYISGLNKSIRLVLGTLNWSKSAAMPGALGNKNRDLVDIIYGREEFD